MDNQIKELIAIGASITANCQPCLEYHVAKARENGANEDDIKTAIAVGKIVRKGAASKMDEHAASIVGDKPKPCSADNGGGCQLDCS